MSGAEGEKDAKEENVEILVNENDEEKDPGAGAHPFKLKCVNWTPVPHTGSARGGGGEEPAEPDDDEPDDASDADAGDAGAAKASCARWRPRDDTMRSSNLAC